MRVISICLALLSTPVAAHEYWIEPLDWQIGANDKVQARLVNGSDFVGIEFAFLPDRFTRFDLISNGRAVPVTGRLGSRPALDKKAPAEGLVVAAYVSTLNLLTYDDRETFEKFVAEKDLGAVVQARGDQLKDVPTEVFTRYSKALIGVGDSEGSDSHLGLAVELVALDNPYTDDLSDGLRVQSYQADTPRADTQIELFSRDPEGEVELTLHRTDAEGVAVLPVEPGHDYLVSAVVLRAPDRSIAAATGAVWESLWAALTFAVPD